MKSNNRFLRNRDCDWTSPNSWQEPKSNSKTSGRYSAIRRASFKCVIALMVNQMKVNQNQFVIITATIITNKANNLLALLVWNRLRCNALHYFDKFAIFSSLNRSRPFCTSFSILAGHITMSVATAADEVQARFQHSSFRMQKDLERRRSPILRSAPVEELLQETISRDLNFHFFFLNALTFFDLLI